MPAVALGEHDVVPCEDEQDASDERCPDLDEGGEVSRVRQAIRTWNREHHADDQQEGGH